MKTCAAIITKEAEHKEDKKEDARRSTQKSHLTAAMGSSVTNQTALSLLLTR